MVGKGAFSDIEPFLAENVVNKGSALMERPGSKEIIIVDLTMLRVLRSFLSQV